MVERAFSCIHDISVVCSVHPKSEPLLIIILQTEREHSVINAGSDTYITRLKRCYLGYSNSALKDVSRPYGTQSALISNLFIGNNWSHGLHLYQYCQTGDICRLWRTEGLNVSLVRWYYRLILLCCDTDMDTVVMNNHKIEYVQYVLFGSIWSMKVIYGIVQLKNAYIDSFQLTNKQVSQMQAACRESAVDRNRPPYVPHECCSECSALGEKELWNRTTSWNEYCRKIHRFKYKQIWYFMSNFYICMTQFVEPCLHTWNKIGIWKGNWINSLRGMWLLIRALNSMTV